MTGAFAPHAAAMPWIAPDWPAPPGVRAFTTTRGRIEGIGESRPPYDRLNLGLYAGDERARVLANRELLQRLAGLPQAPNWLRQVHGTRVLRFDAADEGEPAADAAVTSSPHVVLAVLSADCLPVVFAADDGSEVGVAHAGWRGLSGGVLENTVAALRTAPSRLVVWLGPAAGPRRYEVGAEVRDAFVAIDRDAAACFQPTRPGHWLCDLYALARRRLAAVGVQRVFGGGLCTIDDVVRLHSHRRDGRSGRMATLVWRGETG